MDLGDFARGVDHLRHEGDFAIEVVEVSFAGRLLGGDDGGAAAKPAEGLAEREMKIEGQVLAGLGIRTDALQHVFGSDFREAGCRGVGGITRRGHVILADEVELDVQRLHAKLRTVVTRASMHSSLAFALTPWPRLKMCPGCPVMSWRMRVVSAVTSSGVISSRAGSRLP